MKWLVYKIALCVVVAVVSSLGVSLLLALGARLPRFGLVPFAVACERMNTLLLAVRVFLAVLTLGLMRVVLGEIKRRALH